MTEAGGLRIGLVAHDEKKDDLIAWALAHRSALASHRLFATGTTGRRLSEATDLKVKRLLSGPRGGDAQLGAMIAERRLDMLVFFVDPLTAHPHDVDVKALLRLACLHDVALALNRRTADLILPAA